jgi:hypothetical protein
MARLRFLDRAPVFIRDCCLFDYGDCKIRSVPVESDLMERLYEQYRVITNNVSDCISLMMRK